MDTRYNISLFTYEGDMRPKPHFFTSDWHIGHKNCIQFDNRPFRNLRHMHNVLINNYNSTVPPNGICYFLGDIGMNTELMKDIIGKCHGTKICILGNHDKGLTSMYNIGFDLVLYKAELYLAKERLTLSHCPLRGLYREDVVGMRGAIGGENWHGETKHFKFSYRNEGQFHLHGHTHKGPKERILNRQWDVGVVANNYKPVSIDKIYSWISR